MPDGAWGTYFFRLGGLAYFPCMAITDGDHELCFFAFLVVYLFHHVGLVAVNDVGLRLTSIGVLDLTYLSHLPLKHVNIDGWNIAARAMAKLSILAPYINLVSELQKSHLGNI